MAFTKKCLWIVNMDTASQEARLVRHAKAAGITTLCIRTSSSRLPSSILVLKQAGFEVYAWRWPSVHSAKTMAEATQVATLLIPAGLDGYIVDPESDGHAANGHGSNDWDQRGLERLATDFCQTITQAGGPNFMFGTTSGCNYPAPSGKPNIPFSVFFAFSQRLFPQTYWIADLGGTIRINGKTPTKAFQRGMAAWTPPSHGKPIIPMAGEIGLVTPAEIAEYGGLLTKAHTTEAHFYVDGDDVSDAVLAAIAVL